MRKFISIPDPTPDFEARLLAFAAQREVACVLRSNRAIYPTTDKYSRFEWCVAIDAAEEMNVSSSAFESVKDFHSRKKDWLFGFLTYDLKNEIENLKSENHDGLNFPALHFFQPKYIFLKDENGLKMGILEGSAGILPAQRLIADIESVQINGDNEMNVTVRPRKVRRPIHYLLRSWIR